MILYILEIHLRTKRSRFLPHAAYCLYFFSKKKKDNLFFFLKIFFFFMSMSVMPASLYVHHVSGASRIQKRVSDFLELEFVSHHVGVGNGT